ncbi:hypothetical protein ANN_25620 [Periplaneta americana]|uniref:Gustatory receptor n=1 Tax=Periplaneta americana TaxID=6978 RepID=A0ABQ8S1G1_PERAM|nr:hypothetical protein ANN_25620 [Periplaneta americana]
MAGLCEGGNEPPGSLKPNNSNTSKEHSYGGKIENEMKSNMPIVDVENTVFPKVWRKTVTYDTIREPNSLRDILVAREMYRNIYKATQLVSSIYGIPIVLFVFRNSVSLVTHLDTVIKIYNGSIKEMTLRNNNTTIESLGISLAFWVFVNLILLLTITVKTQVAKQKAGDIIDQVEEHLLPYPQRAEILQQLKLFVHQMSVNKIEFVAFYILRLDFSLLFTILTSVITYVMVIVPM